MKKVTLLAALLVLLSPTLFAQEGGPHAVLEYFDNPDGIKVTSSDGEDLWPEYGMELFPGDKIKTTDSVAELRLDPNSSLIKLAQNTDFVIDTLQNRDAAEANTFTMLAGKLKMVAARRSGGSDDYQIKTRTAVCGVRGTIFGLQVAEGMKDAAMVEKGLVQFTKIATGAVVELAAGQFADTFADSFEAVQATAEQISEFFQGVNTFEGEGLDPNAVPGNEGAVAEADDTEDSDGGDDATATLPESPEDGEDEGGETAGPEGVTEEGMMEPIFEWMREVMGMEIGTITIDDKTYSKAVLQPQFTVGKFSMGLYIPIIYETDMFNPDDWYHPKGNDEWSFGTEYWQTNPLKGVQDALSDLMLKIKYLQIGEQRDKFFLKVGNLDNMTVGHGLLMRRYANDSDFPAVRRVGVNTGLDLGVFGFEAVVNDLAEPEIFGTRLYLRPFHKTFALAFGLSGIVDIDPAGEIADSTITAASVGDPIFINAAFDLDLPIVETEFLSIILFGDVGGMMPYFREPFSSTDGTTSINKGLYANAFVVPNPGEGEFPLRNYGIASGVFGKIFVVDYRIEYRNYRGTFKPAFYNKNYDRLRGQYAIELKNDILNPAEVDPTVGIYGEAGFHIGELFRFEAGYMWPWDPTGNDVSGMEVGSPSMDDQLHLEVVLEKGLIPILDIHGSLSYDRTKFVPTLLGVGSEDPATALTLFDANTVLAGEVVYPVAPTLDIAALVTTTVARDEVTGEIIADENTGMPKITPSISIETRVHF